MSASTDADSVALVDDPDLAHQWERWLRRRSSTARDHLIIHYSPLVKFVVGRLGIGTHPTVEAGDLINQGVIGLMDAIERFDPARGVKFETFAVPRIRGAIYDGLRELDWVPRVVRSRARKIESAIGNFEAERGRPPDDAELASALGVSVAELTDWMSSVAATAVGTLDVALEAGRDPVAHTEGVPDSPALVVEEREVRAAMRAELKRLPEREKLVLGLYYEEGLTLSEIGRVLGVTESRTSQLRIKALLHLRSRLTAAGIA